ncbi:hypothetical protein B566_EDAN008167 [Ephemera danica]|nr:hypothetical protein B566_EDAN008167 [Ephemera danica]
MENKSIFEDLGFPCEDLDSLSDEVHFMQSSHTQVSIQPTELPVVDQQALDAVFVRPEENSVDALVGNLLNNYIANVRDGDSSESLDDYLATL